VADAAADDDPRLAFVYQEALRGLLQQQASLESLHNRAATLVFAASFASSLLGSRALADGLGVWDWAAVGLLLGIGVLTVVLLWPTTTCRSASTRRSSSTSTSTPTPQ
jgi:hypothetical protein